MRESEARALAWSTGQRIELYNGSGSLVAVYEEPAWISWRWEPEWLSWKADEE